MNWFGRKEFKQPKTRIMVVKKKNGDIRYVPQRFFIFFMFPLPIPLWGWTHFKEEEHLAHAKATIDAHIQEKRDKWGKKTASFEYIKYP